MRRSIMITPLMVAVLLLPFVAGAQENEYLTANNQNFVFYGFARVDAVYDDSEANDTQVTIFVPSEDPSLTSGPGLTRRADDATFTIYPRLTRLGFKFRGPEIDMLGGSEVSAKIEVDFYGFLNTDRANDFRMRHAYVKLTSENAYLLAGQTSDMISPLYPSVNPDLIHWNVGNLGDRRPQIRYSHDIAAGDTKVTAQLALALQGAISPVNTDGDGALDGEESGRPQLQARIAGEFGRAKVGVWYANGEEETDVYVGPGRKNEFDMEVVGIDLLVPINDSLSIQGELWKGENLPDLRGGIAQGINATTGDEIESHGYWAELIYKMENYKFVAGYSEDNPKNSDVAGTSPATAGRARNSVTWVGVQFLRYKPVTMGLEWSHWRTLYTNGLRKGDLNKFRWYMMYSF